MNEDMHRHHDLDLISALAEGRLADPGPAEELVATCAECADAYRSHRLVLDAIAAAPPGLMDDLERRRLRANIWEALQEDSSSAAPAGAGSLPPAPPIPWWYRVAPVAAALVVAVGVGSMFIGGGEGEETMVTITDLLSADAPAGEGDDGTFEASPEAFTAPETTAAASDTAEDESLDTFQAADDGRASLTIEELEEAAAEFADRAEAGRTELMAEGFDCQADDVDDPVIATEEAEVDGDLVWFVAFGRADEVSLVRVYRSGDCTILYETD